MKNRYSAFDMEMRADIEEYEQAWINEQVDRGVDDEEAWAMREELDDGDLRQWWYEREW